VCHVPGDKKKRRRRSRKSPTNLEFNVNREFITVPMEVPISNSSLVLHDVAPI
jgi:hypothetical protein